VVAVPLLSTTVAHAACVGDCDGNGTVTIDELIIGVNIALQRQPLSNCPAWEEPSITNLIQGVINSLGGCAAQATATATEVGTTSTPTNTPLTAATPTSAPTTTQFPVGASVAGRAALIASGLGSIGSVVSAIIIAETNDGLPEALALGEPSSATRSGRRALAVCPLCPVQPPDTQCFCCPLNGISTRSCTTFVRGIEVRLTTDTCLVLGAAGGSAEFDGAIRIFADTGTCPFPFAAGTYTVDRLSVVSRNDLLAETLHMRADLEGTITPTASGTACLISGVELTLSGTLSVELPDGSGVLVNPAGASATVDQIVFGPDCIPLSYRLRLSGAVAFSPLLGGADFVVQFTEFQLDQAGMTGSTETELSGTMGSTCFGGGVALATVNPLTVVAGELCPLSGQLTMSGAGSSMATATYQNGEVTVDQDGSPAMFSSCQAAQLLSCP
jgi:hypothetical protein